MKNQLVQIFFIYICIQWVLVNIVKIDMNNFFSTIACIFISYIIQQIYIKLKQKH